MMAFSERSLDDYVDVAQRIADFREQYPHGSLQPANPEKPWELAIVTGTKKDGTPTTQTFIVYVAAAYRTPADSRPGIGIAWEIWPGRTPYTLGSEIMNAETSAWGRAIIAVGASDSKRGVRSREEMEARDAERLWSAWSGPEPASDDCRDGSHCGACTGCRCFCHKGYPVNKDGTMALSKMSDEQRREAGQMTRAEKAEHTALGGGHPNERKTAKDERGKVARSGSASGAPTRSGLGSAPATAAPDDPWQDQPAGELPDAEHRPGTIDPRDQHKLHAFYSKIDRDLKLTKISALVGRKVTSTNDLSLIEGQQAVAKLRAEGATI